MAKSFKELLDEIGALTNIPELGKHEEEVTLNVDDISFTLVDATGIEENSFIFLCPFAQLPEDNDERTEMLEGLLSANMAMLGLASPRFALDDDRETVLLTGCLPIAAVIAKNLLDAFSQYVDQAKKWKNVAGPSNAGRGKAFQLLKRTNKTTSK